MLVRQVILVLVFVSLLLVHNQVEGKKKSKKTSTKDYCDSKSNDCSAHSVEGLDDSLKALSLGRADGDSEAEKDRKLAQALRDIEKNYLNAELTPAQKAKPELVHHITQRFILPTLKGLCSAILYMGSNYEFTTVPGSSDYDIQFCIEIPKTKHNHVKTSSAMADVCLDPAWRKIKGGPENLLDDKGYLSTSKARLAIQKAVDRTLSKDAVPDFQGHDVRVTRSVSGPATTLEARWNGESVSIDIVVCVTADDVENSGGHDFVGKPYKDSVPDPSEYWRLSYSRKELATLREFHQITPRKLILLRIMKVIKKHQSQLRQLPSYFFKNMLFKLSDVHRSAADWERVKLSERFKDMVRLIMECLQNQKMTLYYNKEVNLLSSYKPAPLREAANYLKRLINKNDYIELLKGL